MPKTAIRSRTDPDTPTLVKLISDVPGFTPPNQVRSSEKTSAIIAAMLSLLQERGAGSIRMQDIAERAGCAVTAIYSRFADRDVLFSAIHMLQLEECRPLLEEQMTSATLAGNGLDGLAAAFIEVNEFYFTKNFNFVAAQLRSETDAAYRVTHEIMDAYGRRLAQAGSDLTGLQADILVEPMKMAIHTILAIYRDSVLGARYFQRPSAEMLTRIFVSIVESQLPCPAECGHQGS